MKKMQSFYKSRDQNWLLWRPIFRSGLRLILVNSTRMDLDLNFFRIPPKNRLTITTLTWKPYFERSHKISTVSGSPGHSLLQQRRAERVTHFFKCWPLAPILSQLSLHTCRKPHVFTTRHRRFRGYTIQIYFHRLGSLLAALRRLRDAEGTFLQ